LRTRIGREQQVDAVDSYVIRIFRREPRATKGKRTRDGTAVTGVVEYADSGLQAVFHDIETLWSILLKERATKKILDFPDRLAVSLPTPITEALPDAPPVIKKKRGRPANATQNCHSEAAGRRICFSEEVKADSSLHSE